MEYRGAQETASAWEVSTRLVQRLCAEGRVDGARKVGGSWVIPLSTQKPADLRLAKDRDAGHCPEDVPASASLDKADDTPPAILGAAVPPAVQPGADALAGLMPLMNSTFVPGACCEAIESIEDLETREIARAEYYYFSGRAEEAARASSAFLSHPDLATRLSAHLIGKHQQRAVRPGGVAPVAAYRCLVVAAEPYRRSVRDVCGVGTAPSSGARRHASC